MKATAAAQGEMEGVGWVQRRRKKTWRRCRSHDIIESVSTVTASPAKGRSRRGTSRRVEARGPMAALTEKTRQLWQPQRVLAWRAQMMGRRGLCWSSEMIHSVREEENCSYALRLLWLYKENDTPR